MNKHLQQSAILLFFSLVTATAFAQNGYWSYATNSATLNPTTANVGIGIAANSESKLRTEGATKYSLYLTNTGISVTTPPSPYSQGTTYGIYTNNTNNSYGNTIYGLYSDNNLNGGYGGQVYGAYLSAKTTGTSTARTMYGLYSVVSGSTEAYRYAGYFTGGKVVVMEGNVGIGYTNPTAKLDVGLV